MRFLLNARALAATAAAVGVALLGASVGGMTSIDRELQAAVAPPPLAETHRVVYETETRTTAADDCPERHDSWQEY